ncbi:unnamed protein product, partial [Polarella glacialis]
MAAHSHAELGLLLALGAAPSSEEVQRLLRPAWRSWKSNPKLATQVLSGLAKERRAALAAQVLGCMRAESVEVNVFHFSAVIAACSRTGEWQLAL